MNVPTLHTAEATSFVAIASRFFRTLSEPCSVISRMFADRCINSGQKTIIKNTKTVNKECTTENVINTDDELHSVQWKQK